MSNFNVGDSILVKAKYKQRVHFRPATITTIEGNGKVTVQFENAGLADKSYSASTWRDRVSKGTIVKKVNRSQTLQPQSSTGLAAVNSRRQAPLSSFFPAQPSQAQASQPSGSEASGSEASGSEVPESEVPESEASESEVPGLEVPGLEATESEASESEASGLEASGLEASESEVPGLEASESEASKFGTSEKDDSSRTETEPSEDGSVNGHESHADDSFTIAAIANSNLDYEESDDHEADEEYSAANDEVVSDSKQKSHRRGDFEKVVAPIDLKEANLAPLLVMNGHAIQVKWPESIIEATNDKQFQNALFSFKEREYYDVLNCNTGKLARSIGRFKEGGVSKPDLSLTGWMQVQRNHRALVAEYQEEFGPVGMWDATYLPDLVNSSSSAAFIGNHRDAELEKMNRNGLKHVGRMISTFLEDGATKKTIFTYYPNGNGSRVDAGSSILNDHCSVLFMDKYASGSFSNIYHNTKIEGGASESYHADLYTYRSDVTMKDVIQHMVDQKIVLPTAVRFEIEKN